MEIVKSEETRMLERTETEFTAEAEIKDEFCAILKNIKSEDSNVADTGANRLSEDCEDQESEESSSELIAQSNEDAYSLSLRCRLCAIPNTDMVDIFRSHGSAADISEMIDDCLPIVVQETDTLPKQACGSCLEKLELCFYFRKTVLEAKNLLLAFDGQAPYKPEQIEVNYYTSSLCSEPCGTMEHDGIERTLTTFLGEEIDNNQFTTTAPKNQITDATGESKPVMASLDPCSVTLVPTKTHSRNNFNRDESSSFIIDKHQEDLSMDILNSGKTSAFHIDRQSLYESGVPERTHGSFRPKIRETLRTYCEEEFDNSGSLAVHREARTIKTRSRRKSGVNTFTNAGKGNRCEHDPESSYECLLCKETFNALSLLKLHEAVHSKNGDYRCSQCDELFQSDSMMKKHMAVHTSEKPWVCDYCKKGYCTKNDLKDHLSNCHKRPELGKRPYVCDLCAKPFKNESSLQCHSKLHTNEGVHSCEYCEKKFISKSKRDQHHRVHTKERPYKCHICEKTFPHTASLRRHATVHSNKRCYPCSLCNKSFKSSEARNKHAPVHREERRWLCDYCKKGFRTKTNLKDHLSYCHKRPEFGKRLYTCNLCAKPFKNEPSLWRHSKLHTNEGLHSCEYCGKQFISRSKRDEHRRIHTKERPYKCHICEKTFTWAAVLRRHATVHSNKRCYPCSLCNKSFKSSEARNKHAPVHIHERPWQCVHCESNYKYKRALQVHMKNCIQRYKSSISGG